MIFNREVALNISKSSYKSSIYLNYLAWQFFLTYLHSAAKLFIPMTISNNTISKGFIAAGVINLSVLIFSRFLTNATIPEVDPSVMSVFGMIMIVLWGLAYIAVASHFTQIKWLVGVFALEKLAYGIVWMKWIMGNSLTEVFEKDVMAGMFYASYGLNDLLFFLFFSFVFVRLHFKLA